ncbi:MAG: hypothetical protein P8Y53_12270 [Pseudolabrys sp.]
MRHDVEDVRKDCEDLVPDFTPDDVMQGAASIKLGGAHALFVDAETLCNRRMAGANCTNHDCELQIWKRAGTRSWRKVFDEDLFRKFISVNDKDQFRLMAVSIYAGDRHCHPKPGKSHLGGQSCDALMRYRKNRFVWQVIR